MTISFSRTLAATAVVLGGLYLLVLPNWSQASSGCEVSIQPVPLPEKCLVPDRPIAIDPIYPEPEAPAPEAPPETPAPPEAPSLPEQPPVTDDPVSTNPPAESPVGRFYDLRLWITRDGRQAHLIRIACGMRCPLAETLLRITYSHWPNSACRPLPGKVRAGGFYRGHKIGVFSNRNTCQAAQWRRVAAIYNHYLPR